MVSRNQATLEKKFTANIYMVCRNQATLDQNLYHKHLYGLQ